MAAKDLNKVSVEVNINGKSCDFSSLELKQTLFGHHLFTIAVNYRAKEDDLWKVTAEQVLEQLGNSISIQISEADGASIDFEGVISKIDLGGKDNNQGIAILRGGSPTVLMTDDYSMASFVETDLASIVHETIANIGYKIEHKIEPLNNREIPYICRYKESSYDFLNRLLSSCGEWFFYDGKKIVVGFSSDQNQQEKVELSYKYDLKKMKISSTLGNYDVEQYDYDSTADQIRQWISPPESKNTNQFTRKSFRHSKSIYQDYTILPSTIPVCQRTFDLMENSVNATHFGKLAEGSILEATTDTCKAALGRIISLDISPEIAKYSRELGWFRVIEVTHRYDNDRGAYENDIVGINAETDYVPSRGVVQPVAMPEVAKVVDNTDPKNMGRVKVQFIWQQLEDHPKDKTSGWMRVQHPDAGSSDVVSKNRGFFFVPEVGDQVMVGYEYGDPNRPFVMGSMYHSNNSEGIAENNSIKSVKTRSGSTLSFTDVEDENTFKIELQFNKTNGVVLTVKEDEGTLVIQTSKDIFIKAPELIQFEAKKIVMLAEESILATSEDKIEVIAKNTTHIESTGQMEIMGKDISIEAENEVTQKGKTLAVKADSSMALDGGNKLEVKAGTIKMNQ